MPARRAPDPHARLRALLKRLQRWLARHRRHYLKCLLPPASAAELDGLPDELRVLLGWHNGQSEECIARFQENWLLMSAEQITAAKRDLDTDAAKSGWQPAWVPFLDDDAGNYVYLDTAQPGHPVREFWLGNKTHEVVAPSLTAWMETFVHDVEQGKYTEDPERGTFLLASRGPSGPG